MNQCINNTIPECDLPWYKQVKVDKPPTWTDVCKYFSNPGACYMNVIYMKAGTPAISQTVKYKEFDTCIENFNQSGRYFYIYISLLRNILVWSAHPKLSGLSGVIGHHVSIGNLGRGNFDIHETMYKIQTMHLYHIIAGKTKRQYTIDPKIHHLRVSPAHQASRERQASIASSSQSSTSSSTPSAQGARSAALHGSYSYAQGFGDRHCPLRHCPHYAPKIWNQILRYTLLQEEMVAQEGGMGQMDHRLIITNKNPRPHLELDDLFETIHNRLSKVTDALADEHLAAFIRIPYVNSSLQEQLTKQLQQIIGTRNIESMIIVSDFNVEYSVLVVNGSPL